VDEPAELFCTQNDGGEWEIWYPHPLGGKEVLDTFDDEAIARAYCQEQMDSADYS